MGLVLLCIALNDRARVPSLAGIVYCMCNQCRKMLLSCRHLVWKYLAYCILYMDLVGEAGTRWCALRKFESRLIRK